MSCQYVIGTEAGPTAAISGPNDTIAAALATSAGVNGSGTRPLTSKPSPANPATTSGGMASSGSVPADTARWVVSEVLRHGRVRRAWLGIAAQTVLVPSSPPVSSAAPTLGGGAVRGSTLTAGQGSWSGIGNTYAYQWQRDTGIGFTDMCKLGAGMDHPRFDSNRILLNELVITGAFVYDPDGFPRALELLASPDFPTDVLIESDDVSLEGLYDAVERLVSGELPAKVMIAPSRGNGGGR